jgi:hypothetical protein
MLPLSTTDAQKLKLPVAHAPLMININNAKCRTTVISTYFTFKKFRLSLPLPGNQGNKQYNKA